MKVRMLPASALSVGLDFRLDDDPDEMAELAASVEECGVLQPLLVRPLGRSSWEVVAGRRRLAAARTVGLAEVPCVERALTDDQAAEVALAENLHRRQLSPIEEALAYARLRDQGLQGQQIAVKVGKSGAHISTTLALLTIPDALQALVHRREMSPRTALERAGRRTVRQGGVSTQGQLTGQTADLVSHWRRRHDRLLAGIAAVLKSYEPDANELKQMLRRLLSLDRQPIDETKVS